MTDHATNQRLGELDRRLYELMDATDRVQDLGAFYAQPGVQQRYDETVRALDDLRRQDPQLLAQLERRYQEACSGRVVGTKSRWPKKGASNPPTTADLLNFAFEEDLTLTGEERP